MSLSLLHGVLPITIGVAAFAALGGAVLGGTRRWHIVVLTAAAASLLVTVVAGMASGIEHSLGSSFPKSFFVWAALPLFATAVTVAGWRSRAPGRRWLAITSVVLLTLFGANEVNVHYAYLPTVGDVVGRPLHGQVTPRALLALHDTSRLVARNEGVVVPVHLAGTVSHFRARQAYVWLPSAYFARRHADLPAVMMLAGVPGDPSNMIRAGHADRIAAGYAREHGGVAPILVFPDQNGSFTNDTECVDGPRGNAETYLTVDVPRAIEQRFGVRHWAVAGFSEGGTCALTLALGHAHLFGTFLDIAGDLRPNAATGRNADSRTIRRLYGGNAAEWRSHDPLTLLRDGVAPHECGWIVSGRADRRARNAARVVATVAQQVGVDVRADSVDGTHSFATVVRALRLELPRVADRLLYRDFPTISNTRLTCAPTDLA